MKTVNDIRTEFTGFFEKNGHEHVNSSPLVPQNDPTLMFVNSGMVQFKNVFTGAESRDYTRATTSQKCVRAGGKHNDLDNVGYTARHHTFFEMLGNFSFGDYFKEEAISYAWELISKNFQMPQDKLLITVHSTDEEAAGLWKKIAGFSDDRIIRIPTDDNFWQMGDTGPCGPCSEIFYDQGEQLEGGPPGSPDEDGDRFLEFWNLVFMQYEQEPGDDGKPIRRPLPKPSIDTGMGLERMAALMQGEVSNYGIDLLRSIIENVADLTGVDADGDQAASHRVIADHLRCASFLMADGVMPSNEGRGYVLRRIMRRGMRHAHLLGAQDPLMYRLLPTLTSMMGEAYPEIKRAESLISETLQNEEARFKQTLDRGLKMLDEEAENVTNNTLAGDVAFKLYDTYGFPVDLTADALKAKDIEVDMDGFEAAMEEQKKKARAAWSGSGDTGTEKLWFDIYDEAGATEFLGYKSENAEGQILALVKDGKKVETLKKGDEGFVVVNQTPFYGESGGQV
ncbi:MAG: alanine--tRNA ligase, partial [Pseudomonadota bacterium]